MPTEAELDWMMPVSTAPATTPSSGFLNARKRLTNTGSLRSPDTAPLIVSMPNISVAKPSRMTPESFLRLLLQKR